MNFNHNKFVRFREWNSDKSWSPEQSYILNSDDGLLRGKIGPALSALWGGTRRVFGRGSERIKNLRRPRRPSSLLYPTVRFFSSERRILHPQGPFLQTCSKVFLVSCWIALAIDPLFFYIPVIDGHNNCLDLDKTLETTACILRTSIDLFYIFHMFLQFRTGFIAPSSRVFGRGELVDDPLAIARRYLSSYFIVDVLAILPLPQTVVLLVIPLLDGPVPLITKETLKFIIYSQYVPRIIRMYPLCKQVTRTSGMLFETAGAGAAFNLFLYMLFGHPDDITNSTVFNFGIFIDALQSDVVEKKDFPRKFFYCFWWGLRNLSSLGQNLKTSTYVWEIVFAVGISIFGLVLFALLIGNMQKYLQSTTVRIEEMRVKRRDAGRWMSHRMLPDGLRKRIRRYEQYKWQETRGVEEESLIHNLPKDLRRDIKRHLCLDLLMQVPLFEKMDDQLLDALCDRLKPVLYTEKSSVIREGDPVDEMLFIIRGNSLTMTTNGGRTGFFNSYNLKAGDFCGEELLTWALDPSSSSNLPSSTRTVETITEVEAFALTAEDLKFVASQFRRLHSKQLQHTLRQAFTFIRFYLMDGHVIFAPEDGPYCITTILDGHFYSTSLFNSFYSQQWRTWAACFIQAAWRRHCKRKQEKVLQEAEDWLQDALFKEGSNSPSLGAAIYASRFAANALHAIRNGSSQSGRMPQRLSPLLPQKPAEPNFAADGGY
ncbi:hypothetical protein CDL15_Pgr027344 [Punica granatum]|uniref:Cyclic nucleotide-binding domain-containing protein n=1 Tax=Punica granatum TaxID=22663 RepID=A0A218WD53_PUNGR|nr:hypothetical protein CDL15_Pgr027344 [Punica granatum]